MLRRAPKYFLALKGSESSRYTEVGGGALNFSKFWSCPAGVFTPTIVNRIYVLETH
jgi:hypothetical protein